MKLTPIAFFLGFGMSVHTFANTPITTDKTFNQDETYTVSDQKSTVAGQAGSTTTVTIASGVNVKLSNTYGGVGFSSVIDASEGDVIFNGGNLTLLKNNSESRPLIGFVYMKRENSTPGNITFNTESAVLISGAAADGILADGNVSFLNGLTMAIDRSRTRENTFEVRGVLVSNGILSSRKAVSIQITPSEGDHEISAIKLEDSKFSAPLLEVEIPRGKIVSGVTIRRDKADPVEAVDGDILITLKNVSLDAKGLSLWLESEGIYALNGNNRISISDSSIGIGLDAKGNINFKTLTVDMHNNHSSTGLIGRDGTIKIDRAVFNMPDKRALAIEAGDGSIIFTESLKTNAHRAFEVYGSAHIDVQKDFYAVGDSDISITATEQAAVVINSSGLGKVQFSGYTEQDQGSRIDIQVGSGADSDDSYWNVTGVSALSSLSVTKNASLYFKVPDPNEATARITVTGDNAKAVRLAGGSIIALYDSEVNLEEGQMIPLIESSKGIELDGMLLAAGASLDHLRGEIKTEHKVSVLRSEEKVFAKDSYTLKMNDEKTLVATLQNKPVINEMLNPATDSFLQSSIAAASTLFAADELLIDSALKSRQGVRETGPFAAARAGKYDLDVPGTVDSTVVSGLLGYAFRVRDSEMGVFVEMGHGTFDTQTSALDPAAIIKSDGKHNYVGFGVYGNYASPLQWLHFTGYVTGGWLRSEFSAPVGEHNTDFDRTSSYWGAHLGAYGEFSVSEKLKSRTFVNYFYDGRERETYSVAGTDKVAAADFHFNALNLHRTQLGTVLEYDYLPTMRPYAALTYEYAFKAEASGKGTDQQGSMSLNGVDLEGSTGIVSLGWMYQNEARNFEFDAGMNGYTGKRRGISAQLQAAWKF